MRLQVLAGAVLDFVFWAVLAATVYSFVHAAMQRPDAYTAADKLTKPVWLVILGAAGLFSWVLGIMGLVLAALAVQTFFSVFGPLLGPSVYP